MTQQAETTSFDGTTAAALAKSVRIPERWHGHGSSRFDYFCTDDVFCVVAGAQQDKYVDLALALGLSYRGARRLVLVLPREHAFATLQRAPWLASEAQPTIYLHDGARAQRQKLPTQAETVERLREVKPGVSPRQELRDATTPKHLRGGGAAVHDLVEWATSHAQLDAGHRRGERAWHCVGQRVLSIKSTTGGIAITAGIHYGKPGEAPAPTVVPPGGRLTAGQLKSVQQQVQVAIAARLSGPPPIHRADEHWLQAVIRHDPSLVGVEQPALREVPAWRPQGSGEGKSWGRGYIDLLGLDGHADVRIVETKLADNTDDLLVFQGLDYYVWAQAYRDVLLERLGASKSAAFEIHYVVGDTTNGKIHVSKHAAAQARALDPRIRWRFQTVHDWFGVPASGHRPTSTLLKQGAVPRPER